MGSLLDRAIEQGLVGKDVKDIKVDDEEKNPGARPLNSLRATSYTAPIISSQQAQGAQLQQQEKQGGVFGFLKETASKVGQGIKDAYISEQEKSKNGSFFQKAIAAPESALRVAGAVAGGVGDVIGKGAIEIGKAVLPKSAENALAKSFQEQIAKSDIPKIVEAYSGWAEKHPEASKDLEAVGNIASLFPVEKILGGALSATAKSVIPGVESTIKAGSKAIESSIGKQALKDAGKVIAPKLNKTEIADALAAGREVKTGILSRTKTLVPDIKEQEIAKSVSGIVKRSASPEANIKAVRQEISSVARNVEQTLKSNNAIYNKNQVKSVLDKAKAESSVLFGGDKALENTYDAVVGELMRQLDTQPKNLLGAWEARKAFDKVIEQKFPKLLSNEVGDNVRKNAIKDVRRAMNDFIESKLPEGAQYKAELKRMTNMYDAVDNIATKSAGMLDKNLLQRAGNVLKNNPVIFGAGIIGAGSITPTIASVLSSPAVIAALVAGGSYKVGKTVITSAMFKKILKSALENPDVLLNVAADRAAIQAVYDSLQKKN